MTPDNIYSEDTQYNPEYSNNMDSATPPPVPQDAQAKAEAAPAAPEKKKGAGNTVAKVAVGAGTGVVVGALAATLMSMGRGDGPTEEEKDGGENTTKSGAEAYTDGQVEVAHNVNDSMSFSEAFAAARQEVGPGGCFEWHGQVYGTYTGNEWNSMSAEEKQAYENHFNWNKFHSTGAQQQEQHHQEQQHSQEAEVVEHHSEQNVQEVGKEELAVENVEQDDVDVIGKQEVAMTEDVGDDPNIEILGVMHSNETDAYYGSMMVDNQEVVLIDVDSDMKFDYLAADTNHNQILDEGEVENIQDQNITVGDLMKAGGITEVVEMHPEADDILDAGDLGGDDMASI